MTKKIVGLILFVVLLSGFCGLVSADILPVPQLKLTVEQNPWVDCYPPMMMYTAQLSFVPPAPSIRLRADFYNTSMDSAGTRMEYLGSAYFDNTGKAVLNKIINSGAYVAVAKTVIDGKVIESSKVEYKVP